MLYLVPTPIGNLSDMTFRAVQTLKDVDIIYAEDTRTSRILLKHYQIDTPVKSYHKFNEKSRTDEIISQLKAGKDIAIISDAGTPGISDPSNIIVKEAIIHNIQVCPLPGATALIPALVASGFETGRFMMIGFLPSKKSERDRLLEKTRQISSLQDCPLVFYEAPHRLGKLLTELQACFGNAEVSIARELTKVYETFYRGKLDDILANIGSITLKGEFVVVLLPNYTLSLNHPYPSRGREKSGLIEGNIELDKAIISLYKEKYSNEKISKASKEIATELNIQKNKVYKILLNTTINRL